MKAVIQRVNSASVTVDNKTVGKIDKGFLILLGVEDGDDEKDAEIMAYKVVNLRVFKDENDKMNLSVLDINGEILVVSQFTLCADCKKGNRPSFSNAASPDTANKLYEYFVECLKKSNVKRVQTGIFAADMDVSLINDGPVTILYDTAIWK